MKKKIYFLLIATIITLFATSCSKEEPESQGDVAEVTFNLGLENAIATRAISDGTGANKLVFAVFNETTHEVVVPKVERIISNSLLMNGYEVKVTLVKGETYRACFWAQNSKCTAYTISEDMKVTVNYEGVNNDELRDAFFAFTDPFTVDVNPRKKVILRRPFAQINVGATATDMKNITAAGVKVEQSAATIKGVPSELNLIDGKTDKSLDVNYSLANLPAETLYVDTDNDKVAEPFTYLSMSYILSTAEGLTHEMSFTFPDKNSSEVTTMSNGLDAVPAKRNWRTNILGNILSGDIDFKVCIDPTYDGDINYNNGAYYNFGEETTIENCTFVFDNEDSLAIFCTTDGQLLTLNDVTFTGRIGAISFGEYRVQGDGSRYNYNNVLNRVVLENFSNYYDVENCGNIVAPSITVYGNTTLNDCKMTGSVTRSPIPECKCFDLGVTDESNTTIKGGEYGAIYLWNKSKVTIDSAKIRNLTTSTIYANDKIYGSLTIKAGTTIDTLYYSNGTNYKPQFTIEEGASVGVLIYNQFSGSTTNAQLRDKVSIAEGTVAKIEDPLNP